jgi:hypothetical protein
VRLGVKGGKMLQPIRAQISLALRASHWKTLVVVCIVALVAPVSANSTENDDVAVSAEVYCYGYQVVVENLSDQTVYFELSTYFLGPGHEGWGWTSPHYLEPGQMSEDHDVWAGDMLAGSWYFRVTVDVFAADGTPIAQEVFELDGNCLALHWMVVDAAEAWQDGDDVHICWTTPYTNMNYFEGWQLVRYGPDWQRGDPVFYPGHPEGICAVDDTIYREGCYHYRIDWLDPLGNARIQDEELWPELWYDGVYLQYIPMAYR